MGSIWSLFSKNQGLHNKVFKDQQDLIDQRAPIKGLTHSNNFQFQLKVFKNHVYMECNPYGLERPMLFITPKMCPGLF